MGFLDQFAHLVDEPPPPFVFEISRAGVAFASRGRQPETRFAPLPADTLAISPVKDNVVREDELARAVADLTPATTSRKRRPAALIIPDYSTRVAVLEFESFPSDKAEQLSLVRFRLKKTVPFDLEAAAISYSVRPFSGSKKVEVVTAAAPMEIVARYEAPLRAVGFAPGLVTTSMLAALDLLHGQGLVMTAKLAGRVLTVTVSDGPHLKLLRCVELEEVSVPEVLAVLGPTKLFAEDELPQQPAKLLLCGFGELASIMQSNCSSELGLPVEILSSPWGAPDETNAGLRGYLAANGEN
jgi:type IV pilus assembly protein PilM